MSGSASIERVDNGWIVRSGLSFFEGRAKVYESLERALSSIASSVTDWKQYEIGDEVKIIKKTKTA